MSDLTRLHEEYRAAVNAVRDDSLDDVARERAGVDMIAKREALDSALIAAEQAREDEARKAAEEAQERAAQKAASIQTEKYGGLPVDDIRAYARGERGPITTTLEYRTDITNESSTTYGSYVVPQSWASDVINFQIASSGLLSAGPTILNTAGGNTINMPRLLTDATTATGAEGVAATQSNIVFDTVDLSAYRFDGYFSVSMELLEDAGVDLSGLLRTYAARSIAAKVNPYFTDPDVGTGSGTISAVQIGCTSALTAASYSALTLEELKQLYYTVLPVYRTNAKWVGNSALTLAVAQMRDDTGNFIWSPSLASAEPDSFMGKPWFEDAYMDSFATGNEPVIFGDIAAGYTVRYAHGGMQWIVDKSFAVTSFEVTFVWGIWLDGQATDKKAIYSITLP